MLQDIDYINAMLRSAGLTPLHYTETEHPDYLNAWPILEEQYNTVLSHRLWFNTSVREFQPNSDSEIVLPQSTLSAMPYHDDMKYLVQRGHRMFNTKTGTFETDCRVLLRIAESVPRLEFPMSAAEYLRACCVAAFYQQEVGEGPKLQTHENTRREAWAQVWRDHVKAAGVTVFDYNHTLGAQLRHARIAPMGMHSGYSGGRFRP